jgi:hypothetical protein
MPEHVSPPTATATVERVKLGAPTSWPRRPAVTAACVLSLALAGLIAGCGGGGSSSRTHTARIATARPLHWQRYVGDRQVLDLTPPLPGTTALRVAAAGHLQTLSDRRLRPFSPGYSAPAGLEAYIALSPGQQVPGAGCRFPRGALYALKLTGRHGVTVVEGGHSHQFATMPQAGLENGITFDQVGRFGHRLLITTYAKKEGLDGTTVSAIDCHGHVRVLTHHAPRVEGGMSVAPASFGRYGGDLVVPDELTGRLYAISPNGHAALIGNSGLPHGQDIGTESAGFVPPAYGDALVSDRGTPHNKHPGDNEILALSQHSLRSEGVTAGDLLVVDEGGAGTVVFSCRSRCQVRHVADGPPRAHIEGHVVFTAPAAQ